MVCTVHAGLHSVGAFMSGTGTQWEGKRLLYLSAYFLPNRQRTCMLRLQGRARGLSILPGCTHTHTTCNARVLPVPVCLAAARAVYESTGQELLIVGRTDVRNDESYADAFGGEERGS